MKSILFVLLSAAIANAAIPVWIDTDPSVARGGHEVDDGFALIQAFQSSALSVRGVSIVFGNAPLIEGIPIGRRLLSDFGPPDLKAVSGAASDKELGLETDASRALAAALRREKLVILMLGPATNVATVLRNHPELRKQVISLIAVAGRRPNQRFTNKPGGKVFRDLNFEIDAPAFQVLLDSRIPLVLAPWEISSKVWLRQPDLDQLRNSNPKQSWLIDAAQDWLQFWKKNLDSDGFNPFDTLAVGYAISPKGFQCDRLPVHIEQQPDDTIEAPPAGPKAPLKPYLLAARSIHSPHTALYCSTAPPTFRQNLMDLLVKH